MCTTEHSSLCMFLFLILHTGCNRYKLVFIIIFDIHNKWSCAFCYLVGFGQVSPGQHNSQEESRYDGCGPGLYIFALCLWWPHPHINRGEREGTQ